MNRAQRRAAERQQDRRRAQRRVSPARAWYAQKLAIVKSDNRDLDPASKREILTGVYMCLQRLQTEGFDQDDFGRIVEWNAIAGELAYRLQHGDPTGQIAAAGHACMAAAEALAAIGARHGRVGKFGATGTELAALRESVQYLGELLDLAPCGVIVSAMHKIDMTLTKQGWGTSAPTLAQAA